jgi:hypothetical protein
MCWELGIISEDFPSQGMLLQLTFAVVKILENGNLESAVFRELQWLLVLRLPKRSGLSRQQRPNRDLHDRDFF